MNMKKREIKIDFFKHHKKNKIECQKISNCGVCSGGIYFLGFIGAAVYYIQTAVSFWEGVLGILKALVWPVFLIYELLKFLMV